MPVMMSDASRGMSGVERTPRRQPRRMIASSMGAAVSSIPDDSFCRSRALFVGCRSDQRGYRGDVLDFHGQFRPEVGRSSSIAPELPILDDGLHVSKGASGPSA